jgi:hypothetical protein
MTSEELIKIYKIVYPSQLIKDTSVFVLDTFKNLLDHDFDETNYEYKPTTSSMMGIFVNTKRHLVPHPSKKRMDTNIYNKYVNEIIKYYITNYSNELDNEITTINNDNNKNNDNKILLPSNELINYTNLNNSFIKYFENNSLDEIIENDYFSPLYDINTKGLTLNAKIYTIKSVMELQGDYFNRIVDLYHEIQRRFTYGIQICNRRVVEGEFINESLREIRENIKDIITVKSQDKVFNSPDYIDICLEQYCPTHADCFKTNPITDMTNLEIKSVLIKSIYEYIKGADKPDYSIEQFYKDILISIFCVFNISRQANNPPPVPYIDINDLKIDVATYPEEENAENKQNIINHLKRLYYKLNNGKKLIHDLLEYADETTFEPHQVSVILSSTEYNEIYKDNKIFEGFDIETIKKFIETIDNNNAVSAIGTLEFVDQIAKYNTTKTICSSNKIGDANVARYKDAYRYKNLYE